MKTGIIIFSLLFLAEAGCRVTVKKPLEEVRWIHGSTNCAENSDPAIQVFQYLPGTWILRQNKCVHYEAPFMFLFLGSQKALLVDTGATEDEGAFPLYKTINNIIGARSLQLVVAHTHNHSDHRAADGQFLNKPRTTVVGLSVEEVVNFFQFENWPNEISKLDLGDRTIEIIPIPGHEAASIALYDGHSKLLLTGDTFYPGRLYVRDWLAFSQSIQRLADFSVKHEIDYILGNHIEMSTTPGKDYPAETVYQPEELALPLRVSDLLSLNESLRSLRGQPVRKVYDLFILYPLR